jgi:divalent metal cation (Fe/Co/Zn/Cd) transporter
VETVTLRPDRGDSIRRARVLNRLTMSWNVLEGVVAVTAGLVAGSVSLVAFGLDSGIEVSASVILAWRLAEERKGGCMAPSDRRATKLIAVSFAALAVYVVGQGASDLVHGAKPEASPVGVVLTALSLVVMPALARAKRRLAPALGSQAVASEANQTSLCAALSAVALVGLGLNASVGWWWADPAAALIIGGLAAKEAVRTWRAESLQDTCCG